MKDLRVAVRVGWERVPWRWKREREGREYEERREWWKKTDVEQERKMIILEVSSEELEGVEESVDDVLSLEDFLGVPFEKEVSIARRVTSRNFAGRIIVF